MQTCESKKNVSCNVFVSQLELEANNTRMKEAEASCHAAAQDNKGRESEKKL
jgi:hypothetical protein